MEVDDLINVIREHNLIENICISRGEEKLDATNEGFGHGGNLYESFNFNSSGADIIYTRHGYDLRRTVEVNLSYEQICMSNDEWNEYIKTIIAAREAKEKEKTKLREIKKKEQRRKDFEALKVEFESQIS